MKSDLEDVKKRAELHFVSIEKQYDLHEYSQAKLCSADSYVDGYKQAQKDLLESASKDHKSHWNSLTPHDQITLTSYGASEKSWQACALSKMKELQEKDEEMGELKKALQLIYDNSRANYIDKQSREEFKQIVEKYKLHKY